MYSATKNKGESIAASPDAVLVGRVHVLVAIGFGLCCSVILLVTASKTLNQADYVDPYIYAGYIHDYPRMLERFGRTYFSTRIAYIYPERILSHLFGPEAGYYLFRLVELTAAVAAVFAIGARFYGYAAAILAAVWLSFIPWLPRSLLWTHYDGTAVTYVLVGIAFLVVPTRRRLIFHAAAGAAFALAVNCNLFLLAICGLLGPAWTSLNWRQGLGWLGRALLALVVGFFAAYLAIALFLYVRFPTYGFFFELASVREAIFLLAGGQQIWYEPLSSIIWQQHDFKLLIPVTLLVSSIAAVARRSMLARAPKVRVDFEIFTIAYLASIISLFLIFHFGFHAFWLAVPEYTVYLLPGCVLGLIVVIGKADRRSKRFGAAAVYCGAGLILLTWLIFPLLPRLEIVSNFYFWLALAAAAAVAAAAMHRVAAASAILVAGIGLLSTCLYRNNFYHIRTTAPEEQVTEWDVYHGALFLQEFVNANVSPSQPIGFWYTGNRESLLNAVQSVYLWPATRVFPENSPGMPLIDDGFRAKVSALRYLFLLGMSDTEISSGLAALEAAGLRASDIKIKRTNFEGRLWGYTAALIEMKSPARNLGPLLINVPIGSLDANGKASLSIAGFRATNGARISLLADGVQLSTAAAQWAYSLIGWLRPELGTVHGPIVLRVRLKVEEGRVGVAVSTLGNISSFIGEVGVDAVPQAQEVDLDIPDADAADLLIIRNQSPNGRSSALVYSAELFKLQ